MKKGPVFAAFAAIVAVRVPRAGRRARREAPGRDPRRPAARRQVGPLRGAPGRRRRRRPDRERRHVGPRRGDRRSTSATASCCPASSTSHTHILLQGDATAPEYEEQILKEYPAHRVVRAVRAMQIGLDHGFTTMRDLETEGAGYDDVAIRDAVNEGVVPGPRLKVVGPALSTTGSYPITHFRPDWKFPDRAS